MSLNNHEEVVEKFFKEEPRAEPLAKAAARPQKQQTNKHKNKNKNKHTTVRRPETQPQHFQAVPDFWFDDDDYPVGRDNRHGKDPRDAIRYERYVRSKEEKKRKKARRQVLKPEGYDLLGGFWTKPEEADPNLIPLDHIEGLYQDPAQTRRSLFKKPYRSPLFDGIADSELNATPDEEHRQDNTFRARMKYYNATLERQLARRKNLAEKELRAVKRKLLDATSRLVPTSFDMKVDLTHTFIQSATLITSLATCESRNEVMRVILPFLTAKFSPDQMKVAIAWLGARLRPKLHAESGDFSFSRTFSRLENATLSVKDSALGKFVSSMFALMIFSGLRFSVHLPECGLADYLATMETMYKYTTQSNVFECIFSVTEYACELLDALMRGDSMRDFFFPTSLREDIVTIISEGSTISRGDVHKKGPAYVKEFREKLESAIAKTEIMVRRTKRGTMAATGYETYYIKLLTVRTDFDQFEANAGCRVMPKCYMLTGNSQIGKSNIMNTMVLVLGKAIGMEYTKDQIARMPPNDKYDTCITNATEVILMDEISSSKNVKSSESVDPLDRLLSIVNNITVQTNQARAEDKGKVSYKADFVIGTSNQDDLGMFEKFKFPQAIINRVTFLKITVKDEFKLRVTSEEGVSILLDRLDTDKAGEATVDGVTPPVHWIQEYTYVDNSTTTANQTPTYMNVGPRMCIRDWFQKEIPGVKHYFAKQRAHVENQWKLDEAIKCDVCCMFKSWCQCIPVEPSKEEMTPEIGFALPEGVLQPLDEFCHSVYMSTRMLSLSTIDRLLGGTRLHRAHVNVMTRISTSCMNLLATTVDVISRFCYVCGIALSFCYWASVLMIIFVVCYGPQHPLACVSVLSLMIFTLWQGAVAYGERVRRRVIYDAFRSLQDVTHVPAFAKVSAFLGVLAALRSLYQMYANTAQLRSEGNTPSAEEVQRKRTEKSDWEKKHYQKTEFDQKIKTMTVDQARRKIETNTFVVQFHAASGVKKASNGFVLCDNILVVPKHEWKRLDDPECRLALVKDEHVINTVVLASYIPDDPLCDVAFLQISCTPSFANLTRFLTNEEYEGPVLFAGRDEHAVMRVSTAFVEKSPIVTSLLDEGTLPKRGLSYTIPGGTKPGYCCSILLATDGPPRIVGVHSAGGGGESAATFLKKKWFDEFKTTVRNEMAAESGIFLPFAEGDDIESSPFSQQTLQQEEIDMRHCVTHYDTASNNGVLMLAYDSNLRSKAFSQLEYSSIAEHMFATGVPKSHGRPVLRSDRDHAATLEFKMHTILPFSASLVRKAVNDYTHPLRQIIRDSPGIYRTDPISLEEALNGVDDNKFYSKLDETTSAGFGIKGKKSELLDISYDLDTGEKIFTPKSVLVDRVDYLLDKVRNGIRMNGVIKTSVKDEPVKLDESGKPKKANRIFFSCGMAELLVMKMLMAPIAECIMLNSFTSECMGAMNHTGPDWGNLQRYITHFGTDTIIEGDYSKWDIRLSPQLIRAVGAICVKLGKELGYDEGSLIAISTIYSEIATSIVAYNGAICLMDGWLVSGVYPTLLTNSIANSLVYRIAFFMSYPAFAFRDCVRLATLGDDSLAGVKDGMFSAYDVEAALASVGMVFTAGDKNKVSEAFTSAEKMSFCKRQFRVCGTTGHMLAPLDITSIHRSLIMFRNSGHSEEAILIPSIDAALRELARHEPDVFQREQERLIEVVVNRGWEHMVRRLYWTQEQWVKLFDAKYFCEELYARIFDDVSELSPESSGIEVPSDVHSRKNPVKKVLDTIKTRHWSQRLAFLLFIAVFASLYSSPGDVVQKQRTTTFQTRKTTNGKIGTMQLSGQQGMWSSGIATGDDGTSSHFHTSDTNDSIFSRPVRVDNFEWQVDQGMHFVLNPWQAFFEDPIIANRLAHFKNLKAKLKIQVMINGNPFYYGRGLMSYLPLPNTDGVSRDRPTQEADLVEATQRPHVFIDPCLSEGGELECPFVWPKACLDIPSREWRKMGRVVIRSVNPLRHSNGGVDPLRVTVFVYAENVELSTPTSQVPVFLAPQSGGSEYGSISLPASNVASIASVLSNMPVIGRFARATEMVASNVAKIAVMFGYSRPRAIPAQLALVRHFGETSVTNFPDTSLSLALDSKKEITVDPRVCGLDGQDEMCISSIAQRECWIGSFVWSENDSPDTHLYSIDVHPMNGQIDTTGAFHLSPAAFVSLPFEFWKGSMEIRLQVACSAYHRGRLRVVYDPDWVKDPGSYNTNYSAMVDITEATEMTFKIGWSQNLDYLRVGDLEDMFLQAPAAGNILARVTKNHNANGRLGIYVVNDLTSPADTDSAVFINVFMKACDDFELAAPTEHVLTNYRVARFTPNPSDDDGNDEVENDVGACITLFSRNQEPLRRDLVNLPEAIQLLPSRQYAYYQVYSSKIASYPVQFTIANNGATSNVVIGYQGKTLPITAVNGDTTAIASISVEPGWNRIPIYLQSDSDRADVVKVKVKAPATAGSVILNGDDMLPGSVNAFTQVGPNPPLKYVRATDEDQPIVLKMPGAVVGTLASVVMTTRSAVVGSDQKINDDVFPPEAGRIFSFVVPASKTVTIKRIDPEGNWNPEIYSLQYYKSVVSPESGDLVEDTQDSNAPESLSPDVVMGPVGDTRGLNDIYFGERVVSLRQVLKRFSTCIFVDMADGTTPARHSTFTIPSYPRPFSAFAFAGGNISSRPSVFNYFSSAFVCARGGMRVKILMAKEANPPLTSHLITRLSTNRPRSVEWKFQDEGSGPFPYRVCLFNGSAVDSTKTKPYAEFELPYYSNYRFSPARSLVSYDPSNSQVDSYFQWEPCGVNTNNYATLNYAIAEDFSLSFFLSTPVLNPV